ncbi:MAG: ABC transporter substrate-binding protein [Actinomycetia bacterium]|nr:ABC transporter substrate-binding protein [Actinomycetes bacterium]
MFTKARKKFTIGGVALASALLLGSCSSSGTDTDASSSPSAVSGGTYSIAIEDPQTIVPTDCYELYCQQVLSATYTGLFTFEAGESGAYEVTPSELTNSVETTDDGKNWEITLNPGFTFTNDEKVTASTFVDTWNYTANGGNGQQLGFVFSPSYLNVVGYEDVSGPKTTGETMSGLAVAKDDDLTIEVTLEKALSPEIFQNFLAGPQIMPMPTVGLKDPKAFDKQLIGNGPYMMAEPRTGQEIKVVKNPDYAGTAGLADGVDFRVYENKQTMWADLQGDNLDLIPDLPNNALSSASSVLGDRYVNDPGALSYSFYGFASDSKTFKEKDVRIAISKAINWSEINEKIWFDTRSTATSFAPDTIPGGGTDLCGDKCVFDATAAKSLLDGAGGLPGGSVEIGVIASDSKDTQTAACNQLQTNLGIKCSLKTFSGFGEYLDFLSSGDAPDNFIYALGWVADHPTIQAMITIFESSNFANDIQYSNAEVDRLIAEGNVASDPTTQQQKWVEAEQLILEDFYAYPYQMRNTVAGWSNRIDNVVVNPLGMINIPKISVTEQS